MGKGVLTVVLGTAESYYCYQTNRSEWPGREREERRRKRVEVSFKRYDEFLFSKQNRGNQLTSLKTIRPMGAPFLVISKKTF
jgi:hypothetical protein